MAKNSEIIGEYIVTIDDNNSISVSRIYKSTKAALEEVAEVHGVDVQPNWNTQELGRQLLAKLCDGKREGTIGEYSLERESNNRINVIRTYSNTMEGLREAAKVAGYSEDPKAHGWNTQNFGRQLVKFIQNAKK
jgi:hypothetical protein